jgi:hypothetical protein
MIILVTTSEPKGTEESKSSMGGTPTQPLADLSDTL